MKDEFTFEATNKNVITVRHNDYIISKLKYWSAGRHGSWMCMSKMLLDSFELRQIADKLDELNGVKK